MASQAEESPGEIPPSSKTAMASVSPPSKLSSEYELDMAITNAPLATVAEIEDLYDNEQDTIRTAAPAQCLTFISPLHNTRDRKNKWRMFRNDMLVGAMFLECANAGDLGANIWNEVPAPIYASVLMGIGGFLALCIAMFALRDAVLSWYIYRCPQMCCAGGLC